MNIICIGHSGQLAQCLRYIDPSIHFLASNDCNLNNPTREHLVTQLQTADLVLNVGAYTQVDYAETHVEQAVSINALGVGILGEVCETLGIPLIHISTDYVFNGQAYQPYTPDHPVSPSNVYGMSKALGEQMLLNHSRLQGVIIRTSWLYSCFGRNFFLTMLQYMKNNKQLTVVDDQMSTPTSGHCFAQAILTLLKTPIVRLPIHILHYTQLGSASWYDFAHEIGHQAQAFKLLREKPEIKAVSTQEYPTPASRPPMSRLAVSNPFTDNNSSWQDALKQTFLLYKKLNPSIDPLNY